jgi:hypothetical protein
MSHNREMFIRVQGLDAQFCAELSRQDRQLRICGPKPASTGQKAGVVTQAQDVPRVQRIVRLDQDGKAIKRFVRITRKTVQEY